MMKNSIFTFALSLLALCTFFSCAKEDLQELKPSPELILEEPTVDLALQDFTAVPQFETHLDGSQVIPASGSNALGKVHLAREQDGLSYSYYAGGLMEATTVTLHLGPAGSNGPVIAELEMNHLPDAAVRGSGMITDQELIGPMAGDMATFYSYLFNNQVYISIQSQGHPAGEVRGQFTN